MRRIALIAQIKSNYEGYDYLCGLYNDLLPLRDENVIFDFSEVVFIEANLCALIGAVFEKLEDNGNKIFLEHINSKISNILRKNEFLNKYGYPTLIDRYDTSLKYKKLNPQEEHTFYEYIKNELLAKPDFPLLSERLKKKITQNIFELYENARTHGRCHYIHICGQFFPKTAKKPLHFTIVDKGVTIKENVSNFLKNDILGSEAIKWAMISGHSTKKEVGGLGLGIIFDFIKLNKGKIHIVSGDGYYESLNGQVITRTLHHPFEGTLVNLTFNLTDENYYHLKEESLDNIF
jgi:ATP-binding region, ATPase-like protein